jgi:hypothetical protein
LLNFDESKFVVRFFPARQALEKILNEYSRNTENALFELLEKEGILVSLVLSQVFKTDFGIFLSEK